MPTLPNGLRTRPTDLEYLRGLARAGELYAILDACEQPEVPEKERELGPEHAVSLYRGSAEEEFWDIAPYLVKVDEPLLDWIVATLWQEPWGIFVHSRASLEELRTHFRRFLIVLDPDGEKMYFRYYDPRVLKAFLPTCTRDELMGLYARVVSYCALDDVSEQLLRIEWHPRSGA